MEKKVYFFIYMFLLVFCLYYIRIFYVCKIMLLIIKNFFININYNKFYLYRYRMLYKLK